MERRHSRMYGYEHTRDDLEELLTTHLSLCWYTLWQFPADSPETLKSRSRNLCDPTYSSMCSTNVFSQTLSVCESGSVARRYRRVQQPRPHGDNNCQLQASEERVTNSSIIPSRTGSNASIVIHSRIRITGILGRTKLVVFLISLGDRSSM